jgi:hypothetical protein
MDTRLAHDNPGLIRLPLDEVWHPEIQVVNRQRTLNTLPDTVDVHASGIVTYRQRMWGDFTQPLDLQDFPFDHHEFSLIFVAAAGGAGQVMFIQDPDIATGMSDRFTLADWHINEIKAAGVMFNPVPNVQQPTPGFKFSFTADRDIDYYIYKVIIPLLLLVAMSWIVFWVDIKEAGTQISVSITTILTLTAYRFALANSVPNVPYMTRMDNLILSATMMTFAALCLVVVISFYRRTDRMPTALHIQKWCRVVFPGLTVMLVSWGFLN